ncbi:MAG: hypothetical protein IIB55_06395 [Planctomycetes bacterium]|nr:hypothetical protein [Planctomycetota bacterium]
MQARRMLLRFFVASLAVTGALGVTALLMEFPFKEELLGTSFLLTIYSLAGLVCAFVISRRTLAAAAWVGAGLLALSLCGWLVLVWSQHLVRFGALDPLPQVSASANVLGVFVMHGVLLMLVRFKRSWGKLVRFGTIACAAVVALWAILAFWDWYWLINESLGRVVGAIAIVGSLGTIATPLLARLEGLDRDAEGDATLTGVVPVSLTCPRCARALVIAANKTRRCQGCGLKISVRFQEPRCGCGYLLHGLTGDTCPECGRSIPTGDQRRAWVAPDEAQPVPDAESETDAESEPAAGEGSDHAIRRKTSEPSRTQTRRPAHH